MAMRKSSARRFLQVLLTGPALALGTPALAADRVLQVVDLSDKGMSTEGGEAKLFRLIGSPNGTCKIEVTHNGETGYTSLRFVFDRQLRFAAQRTYSYDGHIFELTNLKPRLTREINLSSPEGARELPPMYSEYRAFFDPAKLAQCNRAARR